LVRGGSFIALSESDQSAFSRRLVDFQSNFNFFWFFLIFFDGFWRICDGFWILTRRQPKSVKNFQYSTRRQPIFDTSSTVLIAFLPVADAFLLVADAFLPVDNKNNSKTDKNRQKPKSDRIRLKFDWTVTERWLIADASATECRQAIKTDLDTSATVLIASELVF
jgi:hypothetical protein